MVNYKQVVQTLGGVIIAGALTLGPTFIHKKSNAPKLSKEIVYQEVQNDLLELEKRLDMYLKDNKLTRDEANYLDEKVENLYTFVNKSSLPEEDKESLKKKIRNSLPGKFEYAFSNYGKVALKYFLEKEYLKRGKEKEIEIACLTERERIENGVEFFFLGAYVLLVGFALGTLGIIKKSIQIIGNLNRHRH